MNDRKISGIGPAAYSRSIEPLRNVRRWKHPILGFDTEYHSKTRELISVQLSSGDRTLFAPWPKGKRLTPQWLFQESIKLVGSAEKVLLVTYFSLAELQHLPLVAEGFNVREYANGSLDVEFAARGGTVHIFDLARWFDRRGLASAAQSVGLEKYEYDVTSVTRRCLRDKKFIEYAKQDAWVQREILMRLREHFLKDTGIDPLVAKTAASASANAYRHKHVRKKLYCDDNRVRYLALRCAWGGRAEAFRRGCPRGKYTEYDITSAYPSSAIALDEMPVQGSWRAFKSLKSARNMRGGMCRVNFRFPSDEAYPCLPVDAGDCLLFPLSGESYCTLAEARVAQDFGADVQVLEGYGYSRGTDTLARYLRWTLEERAKAEGAGRVMYKLFGNAIIGKFAQQISKVPIDEYMRLAEEHDVLLDELFELNRTELEALGARSTVSVGSVWMPCWNSLITGYTRAYLARMVRSGMAAYCHTDSAWCRDEPRVADGGLSFGPKGGGHVRLVRTRFASIGEPTERAVKAGESHVAHHSVWTLRAACSMLRKFTGQTFTQRYPVKRPLKLRESIKSGRPVGLWVTEWKRANTKWCGKRQLLERRYTRPWADVSQYAAWKAKQK